MSFQTEMMGFGENRIKIIHRSKQRIDGAVIGNVIAEIDHWRFEDRRQPYGVDAQAR